MNRATMIYVAVALATAAGAWSMRPHEFSSVAYEDTGEALFPGFVDPTVATSLEVVGWDEEAAKVVTFKVQQKGGVWVIPSHNDYPADGTKRMGEAAASFIDVKKDMYFGENVADHAKFGVLDPQGATGEGEEKGKRITLEDESGKTIVDIIVGKKVEGKEGMYYVRYPSAEGDDRNAAARRVYGARIDLNITTKFGDWIEKDLLHVERDEITTVIYDPYTVDETAGQVLGRNPVIAKLETSGPEDVTGEWKASEGTKVPDGKELDNFKVRQMASAVANIQIVGVRPRPEQLTLRDLQSKGFFVASDASGSAQLFGNEGQASIVTKDGLRYTLFFGEVTYESGLALTAGENATADSPVTPADDAESDAPGGEDAAVVDADTEADKNRVASRYMWVDVTYDEALDATLRQNEAKGAEAPTGEAPTEDPAADGDASPDDPADEEKKIEGRARAEKLGNRFSRWYYVISDSSYKQIRKERDELFKAVAPPNAAG